MHQGCVRNIKRMLGLLVFLWLSTIVCLIYHFPCVNCIKSSGQHLTPVPPSSSDARGTRGRLDLVKNNKRRRFKKSFKVPLIDVRGGQDLSTRSSSAALPGEVNSGVQSGSNELSSPSTELSDLYRVAHSYQSGDLLAYLQTHEEFGLSHAEAERRLKLYGKNVLQGELSTSIWKLILEQIQDRLVQILICVAISSSVLASLEDDAHAFTEPIVITSILLINGIVGVWQSKSAESSLEALKKLQPATVNVLRQGMWIGDYPSENLVPGDIISVRVGDKIPADARIFRLKTTSFSSDESSLTGESVAVPKVSEMAPQDAVISGKYNMIFAGTMVNNGACLAVVVGTGMQTEIGAINEGVKQAGQAHTKTPLAEQLDVFGNQLSVIIGIVCVAMWCANIPKFHSAVFSTWYQGAMYYAKIAVALGVAAIPEGLPAVITLCLSLGTRRMAKRNVIVRNLPSVETLGCTSVICTDKTGTLTTNQMTVTSMITFEIDKLGEQVQINKREVEGVSYEPIGDVENFSQKDMQSQGFQDFATICSLCNDAVLEYKDNAFGRTGEPTEAALKVLVEKLGVLEITKASDPMLLIKQCNDYWESNYDKLATLEFNRERKSMSTLCRSKRSKAQNYLFVKGAAEVLIDRCSKLEFENGVVVDVDGKLRSKLKEVIAEVARKPLRCLAMAKKTGGGLGRELNELRDRDAANACSALQDPSRFASIESDLTLVGLCGIKDPARPEVAESILKCKEAGVRIMMITGDSKETAVSIARDVNIFTPEEEVNNRAFTSKEFFELPILEQLDVLKDGNVVFCRAEPRDKQKLIVMLEKLNEIVAMTGDGVNDAPALKQAAIGVAMGITGTEVAKNAADMVLADDNFSTIVSAVEEGRAIYGNMQSFICFLISTNIGEILTIFVSAVMGLPEPLTSLHLLWVNLVTDGPPATALGFNPPEPDSMSKPPRSKHQAIMSKWLLIRYVVTGLYVGASTIGIFVWWYVDKGVSLMQLMNWDSCLSWDSFSPSRGMEGHGCDIFTEYRTHPQTLSLSVLVVIELVKALSAISLNTSIFRMPPWKNRWLIPSIVLPAMCHLALLYVPVLSHIFGLVPLTKQDWKMVLMFSMPILILEEILKIFGRIDTRKQFDKIRKEK